MNTTKPDQRLTSKLAELGRRAQAFSQAQRGYIPDQLGYLILVPTLRCNLACSYCQVSRVAETARGFDWSEKILGSVLKFISELDSTKMKIEFQGGEPLLAIDMLWEVREFCLKKFDKVEFVVCTNLQSVGEDAWVFLGHEDVYISTSFDGTKDIHKKQRMSSDSEMQSYLTNYQELLDRFGPDKISALPTMDPENLPRVGDLLDEFLSRGQSSIFLRPVANYGFARKAHDAEIIPQKWYDYYLDVIREMVRRNFEIGTNFEEYYLTLCLRRMLRSDVNGHVDLRNPSLLGKDYLLIDYDGSFYPTDEARMLTRTGQIDLSVGSVYGGLDHKKLDILNSSASNFGNPECDACRHQLYCGRDVIDDLSRYGRIDVPRSETEFCKRHIFMFGLVEELLASQTPEVQHSLALWAGIPEWDKVLSEVAL